MVTAADARNRGPITVSIMLATTMQALDTTIANVALPHMQGSLNATQEQVSWILTSYIIAAVMLVPALTDVGVAAPAIMLLAFIPMLFIASSYLPCA